MQQRTLGPEGPTVGAIGLGGMPMSVKGDRPSEADSVRLLIRAAELGMTLWDTADAYCLNDTETGHNERLFAKAYGELPTDLREKVVIATKGGHIRPEGRWEQDGRPEHLQEAIDASLKALHVDCIPLYQYHRPDPKVPYADSMGAIAEAQTQGKVRWIGISNANPEQIEMALSIVPILSVQNQYSPNHRQPETDGALEKCREHGLAFLPWSPLNGIGGAKGLGQEGPLAEMAREMGVSPHRIVLAWLLGKYDRMLPIPGASRVASVEDSARADEITLSNEQVSALDAAFV